MFGFVTQRGVVDLKLCYGELESLVTPRARQKLENAVATDIMHMHHGKLEYYRGDYETFEKASLEAARRQHVLLDEPFLLQALRKLKRRLPPDSTVRSP